MTVDTAARPDAAPPHGTTTTWSFVRRAVTAHAGPDRATPVRGRLAAETPFGSREVTVVLGAAAGVDGEQWLNVEVPDAPNGTTGWVPAAALVALRTTTRHLEVDTGRCRAVLRRGDDVLWSAPVGVGRAAWPTPTGRFYVRARLVPPRAARLYGAYAFVTSCTTPHPPWPGAVDLAIHGTDRPERIPGAVSAGCVRMRDEDVLRLRPLLPLGARVTLR